MFVSVASVGEPKHSYSKPHCLFLCVSPSGFSQPRPPEHHCFCLSSLSLLGPAAAAAQCDEARNNGPEAGLVGPDRRRGGAHLKSRPARHEAAEEGRGEAEVRHPVV